MVCLVTDVEGCLRFFCSDVVRPAPEAHSVRTVTSRQESETDQREAARKDIVCFLNGQSDVALRRIGRRNVGCKFRMDKQNNFLPLFF